MKASDIVEIIKAGGEANVAKIVFKELTIEYKSEESSPEYHIKLPSQESNPLGSDRKTPEQIDLFEQSLKDELLELTDFVAAEERRMKSGDDND